MVAKTSEVSNLRMALIQMEVEPNQPQRNVQKMLQCIRQEKDQGIDLIIFPELAVSGYMIGDQWQSLSLLEDFASYNQDIADASKGVTVIWGNVELDPKKINRDGGVRKYSSAFLASNGKLLKKTIRKTNLPAYGEFDDPRYFFSMADMAMEQGVDLVDVLEPFEITVNGMMYKIGIILCEDMWWKHYGADRNIAEILRQKGADFIVNLSCSPWTMTKSQQREETIQHLFPSGQGIPFGYCNMVGLQDVGKTVLCFDGDSVFYGTDGRPVTKTEKFHEATVRVMLQKNKNGVLKITNDELRMSHYEKKKHVADVHDAIVYGIRKFMERIGKNRVVIGLSGGIDSSVAAALWVEALGEQHVYGVNMPTEFNSKTTKAAATLLAKNLQIHYGILSIQESFQSQIQHLESFSFHRGKSRTAIKLSELNLENVQARIRGSADLVGLASTLDAIVSCNGNKTEFAFGYATLYGDLVGALAPLGDLCKSMIFKLGQEINERAGSEKIPAFIFETLTPSAELGLHQKADQGEGDPFYYPYHDKLAAAFAENLWQPEDVLKMFLDHTLEEKFHLKEEELLKFFGSRKKLIEDLEKSWKLFHGGIFKRLQAPPIFKIQERSFGFDLREAQLAPYLSKNYFTMKLQYLDFIEK